MNRLIILAAEEITTVYTIGLVILAWSDGVQLALVGLLSTAIVAFISPVVLARSSAKINDRKEKLAAKIRKEEREADWARQDALAEILRTDALDASDKVVEANRATTDAIIEALGQIAKLQKSVDTTHSLVNSDKTAGMVENLGNLRRTETLLNVIIDMNKSNGIPPTAAAIEAVQKIHDEVDELAIAIDDRLRKQHEAELAAINDDAAARQEKAADAQGAAAELQNVAAEKQNATVQSLIDRIEE